MNNHLENKSGVIFGTVLIFLAIGVLGAVAFAPRESLAAWAIVMDTVVRPTVSIVTGN